jgi:hypothetical protein
VQRIDVNVLIPKWVFGSENIRFLEDLAGEEREEREHRDERRWKGSQKRRGGKEHFHAHSLTNTNV